LAKVEDSQFYEDAISKEEEPVESIKKRYILL